jgi:hypothetical protein
MITKKIACLHHSTSIDAPVEKVFAYRSTPENLQSTKGRAERTWGRCTNLDRASRHRSIPPQRFSRVSLKCPWDKQGHFSTSAELPEKGGFVQLFLTIDEKAPPFSLLSGCAQG